MWARHVHTPGRRDRGSRRLGIPQRSDAGIDPVLAPRVCRGCGEAFTPARAHQAHCRPSCRMRNEATSAAVGLFASDDLSQGEP